MVKNLKNRRLILLASTVLLAICVGAWAVSSKQNKTDTGQQPSQTSVQSTEPQQPAEQQNSQPNQTSQQKYLKIEQWGIKVPLTERTKTATYKIENGNVYFLVKVPGADSVCDNQAALSRIGINEDLDDGSPITKEDIEKIAIRIGDYLYWLQGSQSQCSEDENIQNYASQIRSDWLDQQQKIQKI